MDLIRVVVVFVVVSVVAVVGVVAVMAASAWLVERARPEGVLLLFVVAVTSWAFAWWIRSVD